MCDFGRVRARLADHGFRDKRWTAVDKRDEIRDVIKLHKRDRDQVVKKVEELRRQQYMEIRNLKREVREYRLLLDTARNGDKQRLRNTLRSHRPTQIAFMEQPQHKVVEHMEQVNFRLTKEMNRTRCLQRQRARVFLVLEGEAGKLRQQRQVRAAEAVHGGQSGQEQALASQITNCSVKQDAATSVCYTYQKILGILKKDTVYFDAVLGALHGDAVLQSRCVLRAAHMGQAAAEDVARLREEAKRVEAEVKLGMQDRALAVTALKKKVENNRRCNKTLVRSESDADIRLYKGVVEKDSTTFLLRELESIEGLMQTLQETTLVASYMDIFPRFEEQLRQRQRLLRQVEHRERRRGEEVLKQAHAQLMLQTVMQTMNESDKGFDGEMKELLSRQEAERQRAEEADRARQELCRQMVRVRTALFSIVLILNQVKPPQVAVRALPRQFDWDEEEKFMDALYARKHGPTGAPEANAMSMLKNIFAKVGVLVQQLDSNKEFEVSEHLLMGRALACDVVTEKPDQADIPGQEIEALMLESADFMGDTKVPTRESIKADSDRIIRLAKKPNEIEQMDRMKRVRKEERWI